MSESYTHDPGQATRALPPYLPQVQDQRGPAAEQRFAVPPVLAPQDAPQTRAQLRQQQAAVPQQPQQPVQPVQPQQPPAGLPPYVQPGARQPGVPEPVAPQRPPTSAAPPAAQHRPPSRPAPAQQPGMQARSGMGQRTESTDLSLDAVLQRMVEVGASDLHLTSGSQPMVRVSGALRALEEFDVMAPEPLRRSIFSIMTQKQREQYEATLELDFAYAVKGTARFRVNLYQQRESVGAVFRVIPYEIKSLESLGVPPVVGSFAGLPRGLVLVTGPTGSGKSTTLAAIIDLANRTRSDHIMTVEDPIEFLHRHKRSLINQREVGQDTHSFANALKHVLRQDPDIILVGEMRDLETISVALTAAETGHLVFATLHTQDAAQTIDRIIDVFPSHQQAQVRTQLSASLQAVVCQTLCKTANGQGRVVATEVMVATPAIRNLVREGKTHQIYSSMQAGTDAGMHTLDQNLAELVRTGKITYEVALEKAHHVEDFNKMVGRTARMNQGASALNSSGMGGAVSGFGGQY